MQFLVSNCDLTLQLSLFCIARRKAVDRDLGVAHSRILFCSVAMVNYNGKFFETFFVTFQLAMPIFSG